MGILIRIFEMLFAFGMGQKSSLVETSEVLTQAVVNRIRQMLILLLVAIGGLSLFCVGMSLTVEDLLRQIDANGGFTPTAMFFGGMTLTILSLGAVAYCMREKTWNKTIGFEKDEPKEQPVQSSGAIEQAIALLITDFVQERSERRKNGP